MREGNGGDKVERNLLIVHTPAVEDIADWQSVKARIDERAPDIETRIVNNRLADAAMAAWQVTRPSLLFSPHELRNFAPRGGKVYAGRAYDKLQQFDRLVSAGLPTPATMALAPDFQPEPDWGSLLVVKPVNGKFGADVRLVRAVDLTRRFAELTGDGQRRMIVQPFVEHVDEAGRPCDFRILLVFGRPIYATRNRWPVRRAPIDAVAEDPDGLVASNSQTPGRPIRELLSDETALGLAGKAAAAFPEIPVLAVDIVRENKTGAYVILEVNPRGESWHLSSNFAKHTFTPGHRAELYEQFGALDVVAEALIEKTRGEAS